jgi:hypothetical protein
MLRSYKVCVQQIQLSIQTPCLVTKVMMVEGTSPVPHMKAPPPLRLLHLQGAPERPDSLWNVITIFHITWEVECSLKFSWDGVLVSAIPHGGCETVYQNEVN